MATNKALRLASEVFDLLEGEGVSPVVIGAVALAAHGYVRATEDVDLGVAVAPPSLNSLAALLAERLEGVRTEVEMPSPDDPLGGVVDVRRGSFAEEVLVQIVNFDNAPGGGFPALVRDCVREEFRFAEGKPGVVVSAEDLVFFKLYAGGDQSRGDVRALLARRKLDESRLRELAGRYRMTQELEAILGSE